MKELKQRNGYNTAFMTFFRTLIVNINQNSLLKWKSGICGIIKQWIKTEEVA